MCPPAVVRNGRPAACPWNDRVAPRVHARMTNLKVRIPGLDRPITLAPTGGRVTVTLGGRVVADTTGAITLLEASRPAVQYVPFADVDPEVLVPSDHSTYCPYKGKASYYSLRVGGREAPDAAWFYPAPHDAVAPIKDHLAFYPDRVDAIEVHRGA
jgi:uncharacterized protein (DUF427 family)